MLPVLALLAGEASVTYGLWLAWSPLAFVFVGLQVAAWGLVANR